jgi:hypothetical protein
LLTSLLTRLRPVYLFFGAFHLISSHASPASRSIKFLEPCTKKSHLYQHRTAPLHSPIPRQHHDPSIYSPAPKTINQHFIFCCYFCVLRSAMHAIAIAVGLSFFPAT